MNVGKGVEVTSGVGASAVGVADGGGVVAVGLGDDVAVGLGVAEGAVVGVAEGTGVAVGLTVGVGDGDAVGLTEGEGDGVAVGDGCDAPALLTDASGVAVVAVGGAVAPANDAAGEPFDTVAVPDVLALEASGRL